MSAATRSLADAILNLDGVPDAEELDAFIQNHIREVGIPNVEPSPAVNTINSIANEDKGDITLRPVVTEDGSVEWELYIPPTTPVSFEPTEEEGEFNPNDPIKEPWGITRWSSLQAASTSLALAVRNGHVIFNDGRVAK